MQERMEGEDFRVTHGRHIEHNELKFGESVFYAVKCHHAAMFCCENTAD